MIKNIVFDIGNVLVSFDPATHFLDHFKDEETTKRLCAQIFGDKAWENYDQGIYEMKDLHRLYHDQYPHDYENISYILDHWLALMKFMPATLDYIKELKSRNFKIYLLSNIGKDSADYLKRTMPFFDEVKDGVLSYEIKLMKPDKRIYEHLLSKYDLQPEETIFLDDNIGNIKQAQVMGIHAFLFENIEDARIQVEEQIRSQW